MNRLGQITAVIAFFPLMSYGQTLQEQLADAPNISFEEWRDMTAGQTVVYEIDGNIYAYEAYRRGSNKVTIEVEGVVCEEGTWYMQGTTFCFDWPGNAPNCFNHKRLGDDIYVVGVVDGVETDDIQKVIEIAPIPVACGPALFSALQPEETP